MSETLSYPSPVEQSPQEGNTSMRPETLDTFAPQAEAIMATSVHALQEAYPMFLRKLKGDVSMGRSYSHSTVGGNALGPIAQREAMLGDESILMQAVTARLTEVITKSNDVGEKGRASAKNARDTTEGKGFWTIGDFVHSTSFRSVEGILETGVLSSEFHGAEAKTDTTPLEADFSEIVDKITATEQALGNSQRTYEADRGGNETILVKFRRDSDSMDYGEDSSGNLDESPAHRTVFVGLPSSEISGIMLSGHSSDADRLIGDIVASGQYIPIYDQDGTLLLGVDEFALRSGIEPEVAGELPDRSDDIEKTKNQTVKMAERLLAVAGPHAFNEASFSNSKYTNGMYSGQSNRSIRHNSPDPRLNWMAMAEKPLIKTSVDLDRGERLHVWEKDDGELDLFVSSLDKPARSVTEADLPEIRHRLAKAFNALRSEYSHDRGEQKARKAAVILPDNFLG